MTCPSPGGNQALRHNPGSVTTTGGQPIRASEMTGTVTCNLAMAQPGPVTGKQRRGPNNNWSATTTDCTFTKATITVFQGPTCAHPPFTVPKAGCDLVVLQQTFTP
jgi:hypothetical protein